MFGARYSSFLPVALLLIFFAGSQTAFAQESYPTNPQLERQKMMKANALDRINSEVDARTTADLDAAQVLSDRYKYNDSYALNQLHVQNQRTLESMRNARTYLTNGYGQTVAVPTYSDSDINLAAENYRMQEDKIAQNGQARVAGVQIQAARRVSLFQEERKNLESQFANSANSTAKLTPLGTNLYVRNYELTGGADQDSSYSKPKIPGQPGLGAGKMPGLPVASANKNSIPSGRSGAQGAPVPMQAKAMTLKEAMTQGQALSGARQVRTVVSGALVH